MMDFSWSFLVVEFVWLTGFVFSVYLYVKTRYPGTLLIASASIIHIIEIALVVSLRLNHELGDSVDLLTNYVTQIMSSLLIVAGFIRLSLYLVEHSSGQTRISARKN